MSPFHSTPLHDWWLSYLGSTEHMTSLWSISYILHTTSAYGCIFCSISVEGSTRVWKPAYNSWNVLVIVLVYFSLVSSISGRRLPSWCSCVPLIYNHFSDLSQPLRGNIYRSEAYLGSIRGNQTTSPPLHPPHMVHTSPGFS